MGVDSIRNVSVRQDILSCNLKMGFIFRSFLGDDLQVKSEYFRQSYE